MVDLRGLYVAMVTPFRDGEICEKGLKANIDFLVEQGVSGLVPCGSTGESATLSWEEHEHMMDATIAHAAGRCQIVAGAGSNNTAEAVKAVQHAQNAGADAALVITPYYNKPTQEGLYRHYERIAGETDIPIVTYNVPGRTGINLKPATLEKLCEIKNIVGVKEASGDISQISEIHKRCGGDFIILSGDDAMTLPILSVGGTGVISVVGNIIPKEMNDVIRAWDKGDLAGALAAHEKVFNLCNAMFIETNPIPVKAAMNMLNMNAGGPRLPLLEMTEAGKKELAGVMREFGLKV